MIVETIKKGECTIRIHDDAYVSRTQEEVERTIQKVSSIIYSSLNKKMLANDKTA